MRIIQAIAVGLGLLFSTGLLVGQVNQKVYYSKEIGWSIKIPKGWDVTIKDEKNHNYQDEKEMFEKVIGNEIDIKGIKNLIRFQKDKFNVFSSTIEPVNENKSGENIDNIEDAKNIKNLIVSVYKERGLRVDSSSIDIVKIDSLEFYSFKMHVFQNKILILSQIMFWRQINGYDFGININYREEAYKDIMLKTLMESKFEKN